MDQAIGALMLMTLIALLLGVIGATVNGLAGFFVVAGATFIVECWVLGAIWLINKGSRR